MEIKKLNEHIGIPMIVKKVSKKLVAEQKEQVDVLDYRNKAIYGLIPVFELNGQYFSMETGKSIDLNPMDQVNSIRIGTAIRFPDGTHLVYTKGWLDGKFREFFAENRCASTSTSPNIDVFGEGEKAPEDKVIV